MKNIIVIAYQLHFSAGSECAVAMDYITNMSQQNKLFVLYGSSGEHHQIGNTSAMEEWCEIHHIDNVTFIPVRPSFNSRQYGYSLIGNYFFYKEYKRWHLDVRHFIEDMMRTKKYDLIHFLGPIGYREPGFLLDLGLPVIWGPIGGFGKANPKLLKACFSHSGAIHFFVKGIINTFQYTFNNRIKHALKETDIVIFATTEYQDIVEKVIGHTHKSKFYYRPENCIKLLHPLNLQKFNSSTIRLIFVGRPDAGKALIFALEAIKRLPENAPIMLHVVGDGPLKHKYQKWTKKHGIDNKIIWHGRIPREDVFTLMNSSHLMLLPSIYDANTTVIWEAMSMGIPTMALDHCGFHDTIINGMTGYLVKCSSYKTVIDEMVVVLNSIISNPRKLRKLAENVILYRNKYTWVERSAFFNSIYNELARSNAHDNH